MCVGMCLCGCMSLSDCVSENVKYATVDLVVPSVSAELTALLCGCVAFSRNGAYGISEHIK